jgi:hypothetical protein
VFLPISIDVVMKQSEKISAYMNRCMSIYPIRQAILSSLSATDFSSLVHAYRLMLPPEYVKKHINVLRDIPEHVDWIEEMIMKGNEVMLIGADLHRWFNRIMYPETYDRENEIPLCIWLAVVPKEVTKDSSFLEDYIMTWDGDIKKVEDLGIRRGLLLGFDRPNLLGYWGHPNSMFICRFKHMEKLPSDGDGSEWFVSAIPNENNIKIVYFSTASGRAGSMNAYLCPCNESPNAAMCYKELMGTDRLMDQQMNVPLTRGMDPRDWTSAMPYFNVNTGGIKKAKIEAPAIADPYHGTRSNETKKRNLLHFVLTTNVPEMIRSSLMNYGYYDNLHPSAKSFVFWFEER